MQWRAKDGSATDPLLIHGTPWVDSAPIARTGEKCRACTDKADYIARVREVIHLPEIPILEVAGNSADRESASKSDDKQPDLDDLLRKLKDMPGMEGAKARCLAWLACLACCMQVRSFGVALRASV